MYQRPVIIDTGASWIFLPTIEYNKFMKTLMAVKDCYNKAKLRYKYCSGSKNDEGWPVLKLLVGDDT